MFSEIFFSSQVKRLGIITYEHGMYEFSYKLLNDLGLPTAFLPMGGLSCLHKKKDLGSKKNCLNLLEW